VVSWIREHVEPSSQWGERVNSREIDAPAPLAVSAVDDADELHAVLAWWAHDFMEKGGFAGPQLIVRQRRTPRGEVVGLLADSDATGTVCRFLATHLEWASGREWVAVMVDEVGRLVRTLLARYPEAERARHMPDVLCPACGRSTMVYYPPAWLGSEVVVQCEHGACGERVREDRFGIFMRLVEQQRKEAS